MDDCKNIPSGVQSAFTSAAPRSFSESIALADNQHALYQQNLSDTTLELAIHHYCAAFDVGPSPDTADDGVLSFFRFHHSCLLLTQKQGGDPVSNRYLDSALEFTPQAHHLRPILLGIKATSYTQRYQRTKDTADLHLAIATFQAAMAAISEAHPQRLHLAMQYGSALQIRYMALHEEDDLNLAIQQFETVLADCPDELSVPARRSLVFALDARYRLHYNIVDIDRAIKAYADTIDVLQQQPREYIIACMGYAVVLNTRFHQKGDIDDLHAAIKYFEVVIKQCPPSHHYYIPALVFYAVLLSARSEQSHSIQDIDSAIEYIRNGMAICRTEDPSRTKLLSALGYCQVSRFIHHGQESDLESAVENCYAAVSLGPSLDAGTRSGNLSNLALALSTRYQLQGDMADSMRARSYLEQALKLCPVVHSNRLPILNQYARLLGMVGKLGKEEQDLSDIELSIKYLYEALELCYASVRATVLTNLAISYIYRHRKLNDPSDLEIAFALSKTALELRPENHPFRGMTYLFQAKALIAMFFRTHAIVDIEMALDILHAALDSFSPGVPLLIETFRELAHVHSLRYALTGSGADLERLFKYLAQAAQFSNGGTQVQLEAAIKWAESAEMFNHPSWLEAYSTAVRILDLHLALKPSVDARHGIIKTHALSICADATSCALKHQDVVSAVEMFEHSRGLFWTFMARLRTPLDELRASSPECRVLADEFKVLSQQLEMPMAVGNDEEYGQRFRRIQKEWNAVVDKIRSIDGFAKFLLPASYEDLQTAAVGGPVIILNASRYSCDAVIVLADAHPIHIAFQDGTYSEISTLSSDFELVRDNLAEFPIGSDDQERKREERKLAGYLRHLWDSVVCDVVRRLQPHAPKHSRIWWCPTGIFTSLPIHAAHPYRKGEQGLSDMYISSYTPTLSALIRSRNTLNTLRGNPSFVSIGEPNAAGYQPLLSVYEELALLRRLLPASVQLTELSGEAATRPAAQTALSTHTCAHIACHGKQAPGRPYESHFALHDGRLTLLDIIHGRPPGHNTEFAFLSACKTATGDAEVPDEVIHLAAALQFAGVRSVVGTFWSVDDHAVLHTVEAFYHAMVRDDGVFDPSRAAMALRTATKATKDHVPLDQRIVFMHIGA